MYQSWSQTGYVVRESTTEIDAFEGGLMTYEGRKTPARRRKKDRSRNVSIPVGSLRFAPHLTGISNPKGIASFSPEVAKNYPGNDPEIDSLNPNGIRHTSPGQRPGFSRPTNHLKR